MPPSLVSSCEPPFRQRSSLWRLASVSTLLPSSPPSASSRRRQLRPCHPRYRSSAGQVSGGGCSTTSLGRAIGSTFTPPSKAGRRIRASIANLAASGSSAGSVWSANLGGSGRSIRFQIVGFSAKVCRHTSASTEYGGSPASNLR